MKITSLKVHVLKSPLGEPFAFSQGWVRQRSATLVEVFTDQGLSGWGEAFAQGLEPPEIAAAVIEHALAPLVLGADPLDTDTEGPLAEVICARHKDAGMLDEPPNQG